MKLLPRLEKSKDGRYLVGVQPVATPGFRDYPGPSATVYADNEWLHITTDEYEGDAMLNIEALPALVEALTQLQADICREGDQPLVHSGSPAAILADLRELAARPDGGEAMRLLPVDARLILTMIEGEP